MANHYSHAGLPFPVKGARYTIVVPYLDADGDPTDPTTPDTEISKDAGAFADCAEEVSTISGSNGSGYITFTGAEMDCVMAVVAAKVASGPKNTLVTLAPRVLPVLSTGTAQAGASGTITLASGAPAYSLIGCIVKTTGGTGGGGTGGANNQARMITAYDTSTKVATIVPNWETTPSSDTTYDILLTDLAANAPVGRYLRPHDDTTQEVSVSAMGVALSGDAVTDIWAKATSALTTAGSIGKRIVDYLTGDIYARLGAPVGASISADIATATGYIDTEVAAIKTVTDHLATALELDSGNYRFTTAALANAPSGGGGGLDAAGVRSAIGLASANLDTQLSGISGYIDTEVAAIKSKTDNLPSDPADASDIASAFSTVNTTLGTIAGYLDTEIAAIKAKTDNLPASPAAVGSAMTLADGAITNAKFAAGAIDATTLATDTIGASELATSGINEIAAACAAASGLQVCGEVSLAVDGTAKIAAHLQQHGETVTLASGSLTVTCREANASVDTFSVTTSTVLQGYRFAATHALSGLTPGEIYVFKFALTDASSVVHTCSMNVPVH